MMMPWRVAAKVIAGAIVYKIHMGRWGGYGSNPSRSQSSPWATPDYIRTTSGYREMCDKYERDFLETPRLDTPFKYRVAHPLDALLAERRAVLAGERAALEAAEKKDAAWWREVGRG